MTSDSTKHTNVSTKRVLVSIKPTACPFVKGLQASGHAQCIEGGGKRVVLHDHLPQVEELVRRDRFWT